MKYKVNSEKCTFVIAKQSKRSRKIYLAVTRQITQEDINLLLAKTTTARSSQEVVTGQVIIYVECRGADTIVPGGSQFTRYNLLVLYLSKGKAKIKNLAGFFLFMARYRSGSAETSLFTPSLR